MGRLFCQNEGQSLVKSNLDSDVGMDWGFHLCFFLMFTVRICGDIIDENFSSNPLQRGWQIVGNNSFVQWNENAHYMEVNWNSAQTNSFFFYPLKTILTKKDNFAFEFDLQVYEAIAGTSPNKPFTFELAIGLVNVTNLVGSTFYRGTATSSPNLVEFDYFPDSGYGATVSPTIVSDKSRFFTQFEYPFELYPENIYHIKLEYQAEPKTLNTIILENNRPTRPIASVQLPADASEFFVDAFSISSYSDHGAGGSIQARGTIDNILIHLPDSSPKIQGYKNGSQFILTFSARAGIINKIERSTDFKSWNTIFETVPDTPQIVTAEDGYETNRSAFYRLKYEYR